MSDPLLASFVAELEMVVFERLPNSVFMQVSPSPAWFTHAFGAESRGNPITLTQAFPFLDAFLTDADAFWQERTPGALRSAPFTATTPEGDILLRAAAATVGRHPLLGLERLVGLADPRAMLQLAREKDLRHEKLEKDLRAIRATVVSFERAAGNLSEPPSGASAPPAMEALRRLLAQLLDLSRSAASDTSPR